MRTTIDLDGELLRRLREAAARDGVPFKTLLHRVILRGLEPPATEPGPTYATPTFQFGRVREGVDLVKARWVADAMEDEELLRKRAEGR
ncbi:MAG: hypothetical protein KJT01_05555 [Gemmatimonadetes bacterium]|nr:hypothetical protein [Gemmatimonadota bacterium]